MLTTILWDHDGVLVDTEGLYFLATREVLARVGVDLTATQYQQLLLVESRGAWHLAEEKGLSPLEVEQLRADRNRLYQKLVGERDVIVPGAAELLKRLRPHYRMAIVTSCARENFAAIHHNSPIPGLVDFVLVREDYAMSKPDPEPYLLAVDRLGASKGECVVVEDSRRGLLAAKAAGLPCWIVHSEMTAGLDLSGADHTFHTLADVGEALLALTRA